MKHMLVCSMIITITLASFAAALIDSRAITAAPLTGDAAEARADTVKAKKKQVPKKKSDAEKERDEHRKAEESDDGSSGWCGFGICIGDFFSSLSGDESETEVISTRAVGGTSSDDLPFIGIIEPFDPGEYTVKLWDRPGGPESEGYIMETLPKGTEVEVTGFNLDDNTMWLEIHRLEEGAMIGWIRQFELVRVELPEMYVTDTPKTRPSDTEQVIMAPQRIALDPPKWKFLVELSYPLFLQNDIYNEYKKAWRIGFKAGKTISGTVHLNATFAYLRSDGDPQFDYILGDLRDSPTSSKLEIMNFGLQLGQFLPLAEGLFYFSYGIAPTIFRVSESATIREFENNMRVGTRTDELSRWRFGGELKLEFGVNIEPVTVGIFTRFTLISWDATQEKSLTLDYLDSSTISYFSFGFTVGFLIF